MTDTTTPAKTGTARSAREIARRIDQIIGWAKDGAGDDWYRMDREKVDRMRDDILSYAFGEPESPPPSAA